MYETKRQVVTLSVECWDCLEVLGDVLYTTSYLVFFTHSAELVQAFFRSIAPGVYAPGKEGDLYRFKCEGTTLTFSLSDGAIQHYGPRSLEFLPFGAAVRMLGAYEDYIRKVGALASQVMPSQVEAFAAAHQCGRRRDRFITSEVGRGVDFLAEVFGFRPDPAYRPGLNFFFQLRNVAVHHASIADDKLCQAANSDSIELSEPLQVGMPVHWNLDACLQLNHLLQQLLEEADPFVWRALGMKTVKKRAYWYLDDGPRKGGE